nr:translation initiation factor IF-2-like [Pan paniscus]
MRHKSTGKEPSQALLFIIWCYCLKAQLAQIVKNKDEKNTSSGLQRQATHRDTPHLVTPGFCGTPGQKHFPKKPPLQSLPARRRATPRRRARVRATPPVGRGGLLSSWSRAAPNPRSAAEAPPGSAIPGVPGRPRPRLPLSRRLGAPQPLSSLLRTNDPPRPPCIPETTRSAFSLSFFFTPSAHLPRSVQRVLGARRTEPRSAGERRRALPAAAGRKTKTSLYLNGSLRERTTGAEWKAVSAPEISAEGGSRRLGTTEPRRGEPRTGHSAAANAESLDRAPSPASSPVTSISALSGFRSPPPDGPSRRRSLGGRSSVGWGEEAGRSVGVGKKTRPLRARARSFEGRCASSVRWTCAPARGRVLSRARSVPEGPRLHAAVRKEGACRVGRAPPACGQMEGHFVPRRPRHPREDVKRNDPFRIITGWRWSFMTKMKVNMMWKIQRWKQQAKDAGAERWEPGLLMTS